MLELLVVTPEVLANKMNNMKDDKSPWVDGIAPKILKGTEEQISMPLAHVSNMSLHEGIVPFISHLLTLKALPRQWVALETANLQFLRSRMLTSVSAFFLMSLLMVSMYRNFGRPRGLTPSTTMSSTVPFNV